MVRKIIKSLNQKKQWLRELLPFYGRAIWHGMDLSVRQDNSANIKQNNILLVAVMKNESHRLQFFIEYYRKMGVGHFILVDNGSTDNFYEIVGGQSDITTFYTEASYKASNFGMYWANYLLFRYGCGHWCLTCDPDEFLVFPYMDTRDLIDLTEYLDSRRESSFFSIMVDMYSDKPVEESYYPKGDDPLNTCSYFDATGYQMSYDHSYRNLFVQGGVRKRAFYEDNPENAPALNKIPLIKWKSHYAYVSSMHMAIPRKLNEAYYQSKTSGALLHFKFISQLVDKVEVEQVEKQHWDGSSEYRKYQEAIKTKTVLFDASVSKRYSGWQSLIECGLINSGEW